MIYETRETKEVPPHETGESQRLSPIGQRAMQGRDVYSPRYGDIDFTDGKGRPITIRTFHSGDQVYIRAYDRNKKAPPERLDAGQAGYANLKFEHGLNKESRARLQDIQTSPAYRKSGIGSAMLGQAESSARHNGAKEIYGSLSYEKETEATVRKFYRDHGYNTRIGAHGGEEVYKRT